MNQIHSGVSCLLAPIVGATLLLIGGACPAQSEAGLKGATRVLSEQLQHDDQKKVTVFSGNVSLSRDSLILRGDRLELSQRADGSSTAVLFGRPARFSQQPDSAAGLVTGRSDRMEFDSKTEVLILLGNAQLRRTQGERLLDEVVGDRITYRSAVQTYEVDTQPGKGRAQMTILPRDPQSKSSSGAR